jgi:hypothetical protein
VLALVGKVFQYTILQKTIKQQQQHFFVLVGVTENGIAQKTHLNIFQIW